MNTNNIGRFIEEHIKAKYSLEESERGFDGSLNGLEIEIKGCLHLHKNGVSPKGTNKITKGRFWIDNDSHRLLLKEGGMYVFVLYRRSGHSIGILRVSNVFAFEIDYWINKEGNTKIAYDRIFPDYKDRVMSWE